MEHTKWPLTVVANEKWPFNIETFNNSGEIVFSRGMPAYSTKQDSSEDAFSGRYMEDDKEEAVKFNKIAFADEVLRAAAPDLLDALRDTLDFVERHSNRWDGANGKHPAEVVEYARAAIAKATNA